MIKYIFSIFNILIALSVVALHLIGNSGEFNTNYLRANIVDYYIKELVFLYLAIIIIASFRIKNKEVKYINIITALIASLILWCFAPLLAPF
jgi:hypothetical protein